MNSKILILITVFFLGSCSYFSNKLETIFDSKTSAEVVSNNFKKNNFCPAKSPYQFTSEDENIQKLHNSLRKNFLDKKSQSFIEKAILLTLIEMRRRPDLLTPYSRLQVYIKLGDKDYYFDFAPKNSTGNSQYETSMPSLMALDYLNKRFNKGPSLLSIAEKLDDYLPVSNIVSSELASFLRDNQNELRKNEAFTALFFKGDDVITRYDTFDSMTFKSIVEKFYKNKKQDISLYENFEKPFFNIKQNKENQSTIECNFNLNIDARLQFATEENMRVQSHPIAFSENNNIFMAISSAQIIHPLAPAKEFSHFLKQSPVKTPVPICNFRNQHQNITLFSINGKNPIQHFQHLISYDITQIENAESLNELLSFSRHLFLNMPDRILYESKRGRRSQLNLFLSMNFPIYHVDSLGNITGHAEFKNESEKSQTLIIDERSPSRLWCQ